MPRAFTGFGLLLLVLACGACTQPFVHPEPGDGCPPAGDGSRHKGTITSIGVEDFFLLQQSGELLLIDSRHPWFYNQGHIPGARHLATDEQMEQKLESMRPDLLQACRKGQPIVVYCDGPFCHDARTLCRAIAARGFDVIKFGAGWKAWKKLELPNESASQAGADLSPRAAS